MPLPHCSFPPDLRGLRPPAISGHRIPEKWHRLGMGWPPPPHHYSSAHASPTVLGYLRNPPVAQDLPAQHPAGGQGHRTKIHRATIFHHYLSAVPHLPRQSLQPPTSYSRMASSVQWAEWGMMGLTALGGSRQGEVGNHTGECPVLQSCTDSPILPCPGDTRPDSQQCWADLHLSRNSDRASSESTQECGTSQGGRNQATGLCHPGHGRAEPRAE